MKSKLLLLVMVVFCFLLTNGYSQDADFNTNSSAIDYKVPSFNETESALTTATWTSLTTSPHAVSRSFVAYIKRNDTAYIYQFGGGATAQLQNVARYNITTSAWTNNVATIPFAISSGSAIADGDSIIYVLGGNSTTGLGKTLKYSIVTNTWTTLPDMPVPSTDMLCVKYQDSLIYAICGGDGLFGTVINNAVRLFRMRSATWTSLPAFPVTVSMMGGGIYKDTIIAIAGWTTGSTGTNVARKGVINPADPTSVTWTTIANYPTGGVTRMASYVCLIPGQGVGIACTGGAILGATVTAASNFWNFCTGTWQTLPPNALARSNFKGTGAGDSIMYTVGGFTTVGVGNFERLTFSQIDGTCAGGPPPPIGGNTLVLVHDTTITSTTQRKADRDTLNRYLPGLVGNYTIQGFSFTSVFPDLNNYNTIILQETSFDAVAVRYLGATARDQIKAWLAAGTGTNKRSLISIGADQGYNYSRSGSPAQDIVFAETYCKMIYRVDNAAASNPIVEGVTIDVGNQRPLTTTPPGGSYWPDGASVVAGGSSVLYRYLNHTVADTVAAIGNVQPGYVVATVLQDPRYYTGGFGNVFAATIAWVVANGGVITGIGNSSTSTLNLPENYELSQNYPNPFNPTTKINFTIPVSGLVTLKIYNILGKEVASLLNEIKTPGSYEINFNGANLSSGTYFYRLESDKFVATKKMLLLK